MEHNEETESQPNYPTLVVSEEMRSYLYDMCKWSSFLAVVGFVFSGIMVIGSFTVGAAMQTNPELATILGQMGQFGGIVFTVVSLLWAFAIFYPSLLLYKYASKAKYGILYGEQASLDEGMAKLKSLFKYWGIITTVFIVCYILLVFSTAATNLAGK